MTKSCKINKLDTIGRFDNDSQLAQSNVIRLIATSYKEELINRALPARYRDTFAYHS